MTENTKSTPKMVQIPVSRDEVSKRQMTRWNAFSREVSNRFNNLKTKPLSSFSSLRKGDLVYAWFSTHRDGHRKMLAIYNGKNDKGNHTFTVSRKNEKGRYVNVEAVKYTPAFMLRVNTANLVEKQDLAEAKRLGL
jgi:hypothetical protein